jgi:hypothetical protein
MEEKTAARNASDLQTEAITELGEILTGEKVSSEALRFINITRFAFGRQLDASIAVLEDAGEGLPDLIRSLMTALCVHLIDRLLLPPSDAPEIQPRKPRVLSACELLYKEQQVKKAQVKRKPKTAAEYRMARIAKMNPVELAEFRAKEKGRLLKYRKPTKAQIRKSSSLHAKQISRIPGSQHLRFLPFVTSRVSFPIRQL